MPMNFDSKVVYIGLISLVFIGEYLRCTSKCRKQKQIQKKKSKKIQHDSKEKAESDQESGYDSEENESDEDLPIDTTVLNEIPGEVKMLLLIRQDLKMTKGKVAAQCSHAAIKLYKNLMIKNPRLLRRWEASGQAKITLKLNDLDQMDLLFAKALSLNLNCCIIHDAGRTQIASGSATVLGIGPGPASVIDEVTKELKLY